MATNAPSGSRKRPSDLTIAFAKSIVDSKPEGLTVKGTWPYALCLIRSEKADHT